MLVRDPVEGLGFLGFSDFLGLLKSLKGFLEGRGGGGGFKGL